MACTIKERSFVKINESVKAFGGVVTGVTITLGFANSKSTGSVSIAKWEDEDFEPPELFEEVTVSVGDSTYTMCVKSYTTVENAESADSLKVDLVDTSHKVLDWNLIQLAEADRTGGGIDDDESITTVYADTAKLSVHTMGEKWIPKTDSDYFGNIIPVADGQYMKARDYWQKQYELGLLSDWDKKFYGVPNAPYISIEQRESNIINQAGEILYESQEAFDKIGIDMPKWFTNTEKEEKVSFVGSYRDVLDQLANNYGFYYWWDMTDGELKLVEAIDIEEGKAILTELEEACRVTSKATTWDASSTMAKACFSQFSADWTYSSKLGGQPAQNSRTNSATLLEHDFKYRKCWQSDSVLAAELTSFGNEGEDGEAQVTEDQRKAINAAFMGPNIYTAYVLQSMQAKNRGKNIPDANLRFPLAKGKGEMILGTQPALTTPPGVFPYGENEFLTELYSPEIAARGCRQLLQANGDLLPSLCLCAWPLNFSEQGIGPGIQAAAVNAADKGDALEAETAEWDSSYNGDGPAQIVPGQPAPGLFSGFVVKTNTATRNLFGKKLEIDGSRDPMYNYLRAMGNFMNRFYVIKRGGEPLDWFVAEAGIKRDYSYLVSTQARPALAPDNNGKIIEANPAMRIDHCGIPVLLELFKGLEFIYRGKFTQEDRLSPTLYPPLIDFVYWLDKSNKTLAAYFANPEEYAPKKNDAGQFRGGKFSCNPLTPDDLEGGTGATPKMFLIDIGTTLPSGGGNIDLPDAKIKAAADSILEADKGDLGPQYQHLLINNKLRLYTANKNINLHDEIPKIGEDDLRLNASRKQFIWTTSNVGAGREYTFETPYNFYCNWLAMPPMTSTDKPVFNFKYETTQPTATQLGLSNDEFSKFGDVVASPFSGKNKLAMCKVNRTLAETRAKVDNAPGETHRVSMVLLDEGSASSLKVPGPEDGLEGLSVTIDPDQTTLDIVVGDATQKRVGNALFTNKINMGFNNYASNAFGTSAIQATTTMRFLGLIK